MRVFVYYPGNLSNLKRGTPIRSFKLYSFLARTDDAYLIATRLPEDFSGKSIQLPTGMPGINWLLHVRALRRALRDLRPDIIYGQTHRSLFVLWLAVGRKCETCVDLHGLYHEEIQAGSWKKFLLEHWYRFLIRRMSAITTPCHNLADRYAPFARRSHVVPGGVDTDALQSITPERSVPSDLPVIAYCGNIHDYQGIDYLLDALVKIRHLPWRFLFVCSSEEEKARSMLKSRGLLDRTDLLSDIPHHRVFALLKGSDIAVVPRPDLPVTRYAFPSKLAECLASGAAVVATDVSDARFMIRNGQTGWLVKPGDTDALAVALADAAEHPDKRTQYAAAAYTLAVHQYDWKIIIDHLRSFLYPAGQ